MIELGYLKETINGDDTMGEVIELGTIYGEYFENLLMKQRKSESRDYVVSEFQWQLDSVDRGDDCDYTFRLLKRSQSIKAALARRKRSHQSPSEDPLSPDILSRYLSQI